jgi:hypothetical protein
VKDDRVAKNLLGFRYVGYYGLRVTEQRGQQKARSVVSWGIEGLNLNGLIHASDTYSYSAKLHFRMWRFLFLCVFSKECIQ